MEVPGTCQLCQAVGPVHTCKLCGLLVCGRHYVDKAGACTKCMERGSGHSREKERKNLPDLPEDAGDRYT